MVLAEKDSVHPWIAMALAIDYEGLVVDEVVAERPQVYAHRPKGDNNDLIDLAGVVGVIFGIFEWVPDHYTYLPKEWKGEVPKEVKVDGEVHTPMIDRVRSWLTVEERQCVEVPRKKKHLHDVWDAVGLGVFHLRKKGVRQ